MVRLVLACLKPQTPNSIITGKERQNPKRLEARRRLVWGEWRVSSWRWTLRVECTPTGSDSLAAQSSGLPCTEVQGAGWVGKETADFRHLKGTLSIYQCYRSVRYWWNNKTNADCNFQENRISKYKNKKVADKMYNSIKLHKIAWKSRTVAIYYASVLLVTSTITLK